MRSMIVAFALLLASFGAMAQPTGSGTANLSWLLADSYDDGSFMQLGEQRIYAARTFSTVCGTAPVVADFTLFATVGAGIQAYGATKLWNGGWYWYGTSIDIFGNESIPSNIACKGISISGNWPPPGQGVKPNPPRNFHAQ